MKAAGLTVLCSLIPFLLGAQNMADTTLSIERLTVTDQRALRTAAMSVYALDSARLTESAYGSFADLLARHSHIYVRTAGLGSMATVSFRGTASSHTQVTWNGININNPMAGDVDFSHIPVWFADMVDIYRGGSSLALGSGALGGTVSINSSPDWDRRYRLTMVQSAGSYGNYQTFLSAGGGNGKVQGRVRYFFGRADNGFRYYNHAVDPGRYEKQKNSGYNKHGGTADLFWKPGRRDVVALNMWFHHNDIGLPSNMAYSGIRQDEKQKDDQLRLAARWNRYVGNFRSGVTAGLTAGTLDYHWERGSTLAESSFSRTLGLHLLYDMELRLSGSTLLKGTVNMSRQDASIRDRKHDVKNSYGRTEAGAGLSLHHKFSGRWSGYLLVREDIRDGSFSSPMPSAGLEYLPLGNEKVRFTFNGSRNYHFPTLNDLYWKPGGNPGLKPEKGYTADLAVNHMGGDRRFGYSVSLTGYGSWIDDWIVWRYNNRESYYASPENIKKVFSRGAEAEMEIMVTRGMTGLTFTGNYTFTKATNQRPESSSDASKGRQLVYIPDHSGNVSGEIRHREWYLSWIWTVVGERFTTSSNEKIRNVLPAYDLHDLTAGRRFNLGSVTFDAQFRVNNLFGRKYTVLEYRPMPMQNFYFTLKISI